MQGGDDRLDLLENGLNKYNVNPVNYKGVFNRASCTCSPFSPDGYEAARQLFNRLRLNPDVFDEVHSQHVETIKQLINFEGCDRFDVFFAPSGSDLCYYPLLFSKLIHPERDILNVVTCPEELGAGSNSAFLGKYYFKRNQFGDPIEKNSSIDNDLKIECRTFAARDKNGAIINHWQPLLDAIHEKYLSHSINANLVIGSKSGIENNVSIVSHTPEDVLWTVDLCQFRASRVLVNGLIGMNCSVMLTGSKFYQSPPFCAALLVPKTVSKKFARPTSQIVTPFSKIFSRYDIPGKFDAIRQHLRDYRNFGLLLRWEAALQEMKSLAKLDIYSVNKHIQHWNSHVVTKLQESKYFELMPGQESTNKTIVSFRAKTKNGVYLTHEQLVQLYKGVCGKESDSFDGGSRILIGQPVKYGEKSFIRIALGSSNVRRFVENESELSNDSQLIKLVEEHVEAQFWNS